MKLDWKDSGIGCKIGASSQFIIGPAHGYARATRYGAGDYKDWPTDKFTARGDVRLFGQHVADVKDDKWYDTEAEALNFAKEYVERELGIELAKFKWLCDTLGA